MKIALILSLFYTFATFASNDICQRTHLVKEGVRVSTGSFNTGICFISVTPNYIKDLRYRSYLFTTKGQLMIFNSFGNGPVSKTTGARVYHFFPYMSQLDWSFSNNELVVTTTTGNRAYFDIENGALKEIENYQTHVDEEIIPTNNGGVELTPYDGLILDSKFKMGGSPVWRLNRKSIFLDSYGNQCSLKNNELFHKKDSEVFLIYDDNTSLRKFISATCTNIKY